MKALIFIIIALNLVSCKVGNKSVSDLSSEPITVSVIKVQEAENEAKWNYVGNVEPSKDVIINSSAVGTLVELNARKGQQVKKGDILGIVDSEQVRSAYDITKSNLLLAQDGYERAQQTFASGSITEQKFMEIKSQLTKAQASERIAKKGLDNCTIKAPFDGVINKVFAENGIEVSIASPIVRILNINHVEIHFPVPENEISSIYVGQKVCVEIPALNAPQRVQLWSRDTPRHHYRTHMIVSHTLTTQTGFFPVWFVQSMSRLNRHLALLCLHIV